MKEDQKKQNNKWYTFVNTLRQSGLSERTVEYVCGSTLRRIFKHAIQNRILTDAPPPAAQIDATAP